MTSDSEFVENWRRALPSVGAFCRVRVVDPADAEEVVQAIAVRAWRGYHSFQGRSSFLTWVLRIAEREVARFGGLRAKRNQRETSLEVAGVDIAVPDSANVDRTWMARIVDIAVTSGVLSAGDSELVRRRVANPGLTWDDIGAPLGLSAAQCALRHCRALPRLRTYMFTHHIDELGGADAVRAAFDRAKDLTVVEAETFESIVLRRVFSYRRRGWRSALEAACGKVGRFVNFPT